MSMVSLYLAFGGLLGDAEELGERVYPEMVPTSKISPLDRLMVGWLLPRGGVAHEGKISR